MDPQFFYLPLFVRDTKASSDPGPEGALAFVTKDNNFKEIEI